MLSLILLLFYYFFIGLFYGLPHILVDLFPSFCLLFFCSLSTRRTYLPPALYCLISLSWRYVSLSSSIPFLHVFPLPCVIVCLVFSLSSSFRIYMHYHLLRVPLLLIFLFCFMFFSLSLSPSPSITPMTKEVCAAMGTPMESFFDEANVVADAMTSTALTTA